MAVSQSQVILLHERKTTNNKESFSEFMKELFSVLEHREDFEAGRFLFIMDNAPIHSVATLTPLFEEHKMKGLLIPPYSPDLNMIELVIGVIKNKF